MQFIEHLVEPTKLFLVWQSSSEEYRTRYIVAELKRFGDDATLTYLIDTKDFEKAKSLGFDFHPAFPDTTKVYGNVMGAFMRRLPPRSRSDFTKYLEALRLKPDMKLSDFGLLGYTGAKLPVDGFSLIHPFNNIDEEYEFLLEVAGFRYITDKPEIKIGDSASFAKEFNQELQEEAMAIIVARQKIGYVSRGLISTIDELLDQKRIISATIEKTNGMPGRPTAYLYVKISKKTENQA